MRAFLQTEEAAQIKEHVAVYDSVEELTSYIRSIHNSYMKLAHTVEEDIRYIVHACTTVVKSVLNMVSYAVSTSVIEYSVCIGQGIEDKIIKKKGKDRQR